MRYVASREEMQDIDAYSINNVGIPGIVLMEKAALALEEVFLERIPTDSRVLIVTEKGNNGGDGLALGRLLLEEGYTVDFYEIGVIPHDSDSHQIQKHILEQMEAHIRQRGPVRTVIGKGDVFKGNAAVCGLASAVRRRLGKG